MKSPGEGFLARGLLFLCTLPLACAAPAKAPHPALPSASPVRDSIQQAAYHEQVEQEPTLPPPNAVASSQTDDPPFAGLKELSVDTLIEQVLARNPTVAQRIAAWEAARARYPQVTSLDDPLLQGGATPSIFGGEGLHGGWQATLSQKYYWPGKLKLRGERSLAEARAAANDVEDTRLLLVESAKTAYADYYLVHRAVGVNNENIRLLEDFRQRAADRYKAGKVTQQDLLQTDVELGRRRERGLMLEQARQIAVARLNTLLNLPPDSLLPQPPSAMQVEDGLPPVKQLRSVAVSRRPELQALDNRIAAQIADLRLALKEYCPDFEVLATYNTLWQPALQQPLLGVRMNLPVRLAKRDAAVWEAKARIVQLRAELADRTNQVNFQVQQAYAQVEQNRKAVRLYEDTVVPAARRNVDAAKSYYAVGSITFLRLLDTERNYFDLLDRYYQLIAEYSRHLAELERTVGGSLTTDAETSADGVGGGASPHPPLGCDGR